MAKGWYKAEGGSIRVGVTPPEEGEVRLAREIGIKGSGRLKWYRCPECNKCRWVEISAVKESNFTGYCKGCVKLHRSKRGRRNTTHYCGGYKMVAIEPDDFFYSTAKSNGFIAEHRLIVAKSLGRNLHRWELVHHKNGIKDDNRIENLQLVSDERHRQITILENRIKYLERKLTKAGISFNGDSTKEGKFLE